MAQEDTFQITYATLSAPREEMHLEYDRVDRWKRGLGTGRSSRGCGRRRGRRLLWFPGLEPHLVTAKADLDKAAEGVARSAFGLGGQKCSACSRVYVERSVTERFTLR